uniref:Uncharacterized protein n=1 Tax=Oryza punctata TaxID=4537 RepID=A0A0E0JR73_ORYPU
MQGSVRDPMPHVKRILLSSELSWLAAAFTAPGISFSSSSYPSKTRSNRAYRLANSCMVGSSAFQRGELISLHLQARPYVI